MRTALLKCCVSAVAEIRHLLSCKHGWERCTCAITMKWCKAVAGRELQPSNSSFAHYMVKAVKGQSFPQPCQPDQPLDPPGEQILPVLTAEEQSSGTLTWRDKAAQLESTL